MEATTSATIQFIRESELTRYKNDSRNNSPVPISKTSRNVKKLFEEKETLGARSKNVSRLKMFKDQLELQNSFSPSRNSECVINQRTAPLIPDQMESHQNLFAQEIYNQHSKGLVRQSLDNIVQERKAVGLVKVRESLKTSLEKENVKIQNQQLMKDIRQFKTQRGLDVTERISMLQSQIKELEFEQVSEKLHVQELEKLSEGLLDKIDSIFTKHTEPLLKAYFTLETYGLVKWSRDQYDDENRQIRIFREWHQDENWWYQGEYINCQLFIVHQGQQKPSTQYICNDNHKSCQAKQDGKILLLNRKTASINFMRYKKGVLHGDYLIIYMNGRIQQGTYKNGKSQGPSLDIYPNDIKVHSFYENGWRNLEKSQIQGSQILSDPDFLEGIKGKIIEHLSEQTVKSFATAMEQKLVEFGPDYDLNPPQRFVEPWRLYQSGNFVNCERNLADQQDGRSIIVKPQEFVKICRWKNNTVHGQMLTFYQDGSIKRSEWKQNYCIKEEKVQLNKPSWFKINSAEEVIEEQVHTLISDESEDHLSSQN